MGNELQQKQATLEELNERERKAVELRYLGKTSQEIAIVTEYNDSYIRGLFMQGGRLERAYREFAQIQQTLAQETVDFALIRAREEALSAIERIIELSKDACTEAAIFKANEYLLALAGINGKTTLQTFLRGKTYERAQELIDDAFQVVYGKPCTNELVFSQIFGQVLENARNNAILKRNESTEESNTGVDDGKEGN